MENTVSRISNSGRTLVVTFKSAPSGGQSRVADSAASRSAGRAVSIHHINAPEQQKDESQRSLVSLLRELGNGALDLSDSSLKIKLPGAPARPASALIVKCSDNLPATLAPYEKCLYWGTVSRSEALADAIRIRVVGGRITFYLREPTWDALQGITINEKADRLVGRQFMILGSALPHSRWIAVENPQYMAWRYTS